MKKLYYSIISSALSGAKSNDPYGYVFTAYLVMSLLTSIIIGVFNMWCSSFSICKMLNIIEVGHILSKNNPSARRLHAFVNLFPISLVINYFVFYFKGNYKKIMQYYPMKNGTKALIFLTLTMLFMIISAIIMVLLTRKGLLYKASYMKPLWTI